MRVSLGWSFLLAVLAWVVVGAASLTVIRSAWSVLTLLLVAATLAALVRAPVEALSRRVPRVLAVLVVVVGLFAVAAAVTANQTWQLRRHADALAEAIPERIDDLDEGSGLRQFLVEARAAERAQEVLDRIPQLVVFGTDDQGESAQRGLDVALVVILTVYATLNGPQVARGLSGTIGDPRRRRLVHDAARDGLDRAAAYVRRSLAWGVASGLVVAGLAVALDLTGPSTLAVWAGVWSIVPVVGVVVGFAPIVGLAAFDDPEAAVVIGAVGVMWWVLGWVVVSRLVADRSVRLGPLAVTIALAVGLQFGWLVGSGVSLFLFGWAAGFLSEVSRRIEPGHSPLGRLTDDPTPPAGPSPSRSPSPATARSTAGAGAPPRLVLGSLDPRSGARATALVVAVLVGFTLLRAAQPGPTWIVVGVVIGVALDPAARWIAARTALRRGAAVAVVVGGAAAALVGVAVVAVPSLIENLRQFDQQVEQVADDVVALPVVGDELARRGVDDQIRQQISRIPQELAADPTPLAEALRTAGDAVVGSFWTLLVAVATLVDGHRIAARARTLVPAGHRRRADDLGALLYDTVVRYAAGSALVSGLVGLAVFATAAGLGIPLAPVLGLWALLWTFVPQIGGAVAVVPLALLALVKGTTDAVVALACYGVAWQVKNRILMPVIIGRAVELSPVVAMAAVLVGGAAGGLVGAILATPVAGTVRLVHHHLRARDRTGSAPPDQAGDRRQVGQPGDTDSPGHGRAATGAPAGQGVGARW